MENDCSLYPRRVGHRVRWANMRHIRHILTVMCHNNRDLREPDGFGAIFFCVLSGAVDGQNVLPQLHKVRCRSWRVPGSLIEQTHWWIRPGTGLKPHKNNFVLDHSGFLSTLIAIETKLFSYKANCIQLTRLFQQILWWISINI